MSSEQVVLLSARVDSLFSFTDDDFVLEHFVCSDNDDAPSSHTLSLTVPKPMSFDGCGEIRMLISLSDEVDEDVSCAT